MRRKLLSQNLEGYTGASVDHASTADMAVNFLTAEHHYDLIISKNQIEDENTALKVYYTLVSQKLQTPMIVMGENLKIQEHVKCVDADQWRLIIKEAARLMGLSSEIMAQWETTPLYPFALHRITHIKKTPCQIYLSSTRGPVVWKSEGDPLSSEELIDKMRQGHRELFVDAKYRLKFTDELSRSLEEKMKESDEPLEKQIGTTSELFAACMENFSGANPSLELCKMTLDHTLKLAERSPQLQSLLEQLEIATQGEFIKSNLLLAIAGFQCLEVLKPERYKDRQLQHCYAAITHDLFVSDEKLASILTQEDFEQIENDLDSAEMQKIQDHPRSMADFLEGDSDIPLGVSKIVREHHGQFEGQNFRSKKDTLEQLELSSLFFIMMEEWTQEAFKIGGDQHKALKSLDHFEEEQALQIREALKTLIEGSDLTGQNRPWLKLHSHQDKQR